MFSRSSSGKASGCSSFPSQDIKSQLSALSRRSLRLGGKSFPLYHAETQRTQRLVDNGRLQISDFRFQIADFRSRGVPDFESHSLNCDLKSEICDLKSAICDLRSAI